MINDGSTQFIVRVISSQAYVDTLTNAIQSKIYDLIIVKQWTIPWVSDSAEMKGITPKQYDGYKFVCWVNFTSNGSVVPLYTNNSIGTNVSVFCYDTDNMRGNVNPRGVLVYTMGLGNTRHSGALTDGNTQMSGSYSSRDSGSGKSIAFNASLSNPIYGNSDTVQPKAYVSHYWLRVK